MKTAPAGTTLLGNCAEWIVEAPTVHHRQSLLADYGAVYFDNCTAATTRKTTLYGGLGRPITMVQDGNERSVPALENRTLIKVNRI
jgi:hypothetical protein